MENLDETDLYIDSLINIELSKLITGKIAPFTCQFLKHDRIKGLIPFASGVMAKFDESYFILTASHVIEDWSDQNKLFIEINNGHISVTGKACGTNIDTNEKLDIAYIKLENVMVPILEQWYSFLSVKQFLSHTKIINESNYCAYGFPTTNFKIKSKITNSIGSAYYMKPTKDNVFEFYGLSPLSHYVLEFNGKPLNIKTGQTEKIKTEHYGLSGGGLWYTKINFVHNRIVSKAHLIGIMTEFRKGKYNCLIANRVELILALIRKNEGINITTDTFL